MTLRMDLPHASLLSGSHNAVSVIIRCKTLKNHVVENTVRTLKYSVCSRPLGSPTAMSKRSYVHVPSVTDAWSGRACRGRDRCTGPGTSGVGYGWVGTGEGYYPCTQPAARGGSRRQRSGSVRPCRGLEWWSSGAGRPVTHPLRCATGPAPLVTSSSRSLPMAV